MKNILFKFFAKIFKQLEFLISAEVSQKIKELTQQEKINKVIKNYPIGEKFIIIGNEPSEDILIAEVIGHETYANTFLPIFKSIKTGKEFFSMGIKMHWSEEKEEALSKLSWYERFNACCSGTYYLSKKDIERKQSPEYKNR